ncbi:MAG: hypothetical protein HYV59_09640 [Planctomycetes bacterium]|nr:hypothetical protein [Planctomycetota bacterium]
MIKSEDSAVLRFFLDFDIEVLETEPNGSGEYLAVCPDCGESKLYINKRGLYYCQYCNAFDKDGVRGNPYTFLRDHHGMDNTEISETLKKYELDNGNQQENPLKPKVRIPGGYYLVARKIHNSDIWRSDPHLLKLFLYLIGKARHSRGPLKYPEFVIYRGEHVTSIDDIIKDNHYIGNRGRLTKWSQSKVSRMLRKLKEMGRIEVLKDTYGTHIRIPKYDFYQEPNNYCSQE